MSRYEHQLLRFPAGVNDNADVSIYSERRALQMVGLYQQAPGVGTRTLYTKKLAGQIYGPVSIDGIFQYVGTTAALDRVLTVAGRFLYKTTLTAGAPASQVPDAINPSVGLFPTPIPNKTYAAVPPQLGARCRFVQVGHEVIIVQEGGILPIRYTQTGTAGEGIYDLGIRMTDTPTDSGNLAGGPLTVGDTYDYYVTWADELGRESSPSAALSVVMGAGGGRTITFLASADPQVNRIYLYRTVGNPVNVQIAYRVVEAGFANANTVYGDNATSDTAIVTHSYMPLVGENDPPNAASVCYLHKNRLVLNDTTNRRRMQMSNTLLPGSFSQIGIGSSIATDGLSAQVLTNFGDEIVGFGPIGSAMGIFNRYSLYALFGNAPSEFEFYEVERIGCVSPDSILTTHMGTLFMAEDGIYRKWNPLEPSVKITEDLDNEYKRPAVSYVNPAANLLIDAVYTPFTREQRAARCCSVYMQERAYFFTPPTVDIFQEEDGAWSQDFMTYMPDAQSPPKLSGGYNCVAPMHADRQYQVFLYSPGFGAAPGTVVGETWIGSFYPIQQADPAIAENFSFVYQTRAFDGKGVHRERTKRFKRITVFGDISPSQKADGTAYETVLASGSLIIDIDQSGTSMLPVADRVFNWTTTGAHYSRIHKKWRLILQELTPHAVGNIMTVTIQGVANGRFTVRDVLVEYLPLNG